MTLAPLASKTLGVEMPAGSVREFIAEQTAGTVEIRVPEGQGGDSVLANAAAYENAAGLHAKIQVLLNDARQVRVSNPSKDKPATVVVTAGIARPAGADSVKEQAAEKDFAQAELLRVQQNQGQGDALKFYDRAIAAWQALGNSTQMARALIWKSDFLMNNQSNAGQAASTLQRAADLVEKLEPIEAAHYWLISAFINAQSGKYEAALASYTSALRFCDQAGDRAVEAKLLDNRARIEFMLGKSETAMATETQAAELARQAGDKRREAFVDEELGSIQSTLGDFEASYQAYGHALELLKQLPPNPRILAAVWTDLSDYYLTLGDFDRGKDALDQALAVWNTTSYPVGLVDTLNNYGDLYILKGQQETARSYFALGLVTAEKIGYERGSIGLIAGTGESYLAAKDGARAEEFLERARVRAEKAGQSDSEVNIVCDLGDAALLRHDYKRAGEFYEKCRATAVASQDVYHQIGAEGSLAKLDFQTGALEDAEEHCERALAGIESIRGYLRNQDLRTTFLASEHAYYDLEIQILMRLGDAHAGEGYEWRAFLIAERARARTLLDQITAANSDLRAVASQALLAQYEDVRRRLSRLDAAQSVHGAIASSATRAAIARLTVAEQELHREIATTGNAEGASASALTLESMQGLLPDSHAALMEYWTGEDGSYAWSITRDGMRSFRLPPSAVLDRKSEAFRKALLAAAARNPQISIQERARMEAAQEVRWKQLGASLAATLFPAGALPSSASTIIVVGDGAIATLPFAALPGLSVIPGTNGRLRRISFVNEPSATVFAFLEARSITPRPVRLAVFTADPSLNRAATGEVRNTVASASLSRTGELAPLPFTGNEAAAIRGIFGADAVSTFPAASISPAALRNLDWNEFSVGHFAMHAVLNQRYAALTGLSFGDTADHGPGSDSGRLLWYGDICNLHARLDLVVLSACDTALGEPVPGEGLRGLTQAFFAAGSQRVLGTLWEVDDQATSEWMRHFYQALKQTHSPARALHEAQMEMASDPQWSSPYYWAGFSLAGDWRALP
jgi:CHAT domain-containing protein